MSLFVDHLDPDPTPPRGRLALVTPPTTDILTLPEAKAHLRVTNTAEDALITDLIAAARQRIEEWTKRSLPPQTWRLGLDRFPRGREPIVVPRPPLTVVNSVKYDDSDGVEQTLAGFVADAETRLESGRIVPAFEDLWPVTRTFINAVRVEFVAGFAAGEVPAEIKQAALLLVGNYFKNREQSVLGSSATNLPQGVEALLADWTVREAVFA